MKYLENKIFAKKMFHIKIIKFQRMYQTTIYLFHLKLKYGGALKVNFKIFNGNLHCCSIFLSKFFLNTTMEFLLIKILFEK